jgi:hypothetical protein
MITHLIIAALILVGPFAAVWAIDRRDPGDGEIPADDLQAIAADYGYEMFCARAARRTD